MNNVTAIVQVSAIILGFMIGFFNKWLFSDYKKQDYEEKWFDYLIIFFGIFSEIFFALTIVFGLSSKTINENQVWLLMTFGIGFLSISIILAAIYEIIAIHNYYQGEKENSK